MPPQIAFNNPIEYMSPRIWTGFVRDAPLPGDFQGSRLLPIRDSAADRIYAEIGRYMRPMAPFVDVDAEAPTINQGPIITNVWFDAMQLRLKSRFKASDMRWLRLYGDAPITDPAGRMAQTSKQRIDDAMKGNNDAIDTRIEWMQMNSLIGRLTVTGDEVSPANIDIQYPVTTKTASPLWTDLAASDPLLDIYNWTKDSYLQGITYSEIILPRAVLYNLAVNAKIRAANSTPTFTPSVVAFETIQQMLTMRFGIKFTEYHAVFTTRSDDGTIIQDVASPIIPNNKVILLPDQPVGYTATVPQPLNNWQTGKYAWRNDPSNNPGMQDPPRWELGVGWGGMPVVTFPNRIIVATVG